MVATSSSSLPILLLVLSGICIAAGSQPDSEPSLPVETPSGERLSVYCRPTEPGRLATRVHLFLRRSPLGLVLRFSASKDASYPLHHSRTSGLLCSSEGFAFEVDPSSNGLPHLLSRRVSNLPFDSFSPQSCFRAATFVGGAQELRPLPFSSSMGNEKKGGVREGRTNAGFDLSSSPLHFTFPSKRWFPTLIPPRSLSSLALVS